ncbi:MAG: hypothetical protein OEY36_07705 [Gammaproteobacteria bacterium]|nr:hypothetical protein [Gammaproteobacteria bacterium]
MLTLIKFRIFMIAVILGFLQACPAGNNGAFGGVAPSTSCTDTISGCQNGANVQLCGTSDNSSCWYQLDSQRFDCDPGCDCQSASTDAGVACFSDQDIGNSYVADYLFEKSENIKLSRQLDAAYRLILGQPRTDSD